MVEQEPTDPEDIFAQVRRSTIEWQVAQDKLIPTDHKLRAIFLDSERLHILIRWLDWEMDGNSNAVLDFVKELRQIIFSIDSLQLFEAWKKEFPKKFVQLEKAYEEFLEDVESGHKKPTDFSGDLAEFLDEHKDLLALHPEIETLLQKARENGEQREPKVGFDDDLIRSSLDPQLASDVIDLLSNFYLRKSNYR